jgi:hypothetical protein
MEDAIDEWLLRQIHWLRKEDTVAQGIQWLQDVSIFKRLLLGHYMPTQMNEAFYAK